MIYTKLERSILKRLLLLVALVWLLLLLSPIAIFMDLFDSKTHYKEAY